MSYFSCSALYKAISPRSPVRMRMASSTGMTKIRPSTDLAGMEQLENGMNGFVHILFADYNGNQDSLNGTGVINHSTVNASLTCFANASYIVIGKPFDFGFEQRFFYVLEFGLTDNSFNFFIVVFVFCYIIVIFLPSKNLIPLLLSLYLCSL